MPYRGAPQRGTIRRLLDNRFINQSDLYKYDCGVYYEH